MRARIPLDRMSIALLARQKVPLALVDEAAVQLAEMIEARILVVLDERRFVAAFRAAAEALRSRVDRDSSRVGTFSGATC